MTARVLVGDCREVLRSLPERSVQTVVTSPPFFGLRDYGTGEWEGGDAACDHVQRMARGDAGRLATDDRLGVNPTPVETPMRFRDVCGRCGARRVDRQIGLEASPDEYVAALVGVFREVRRVLRDDGTVWLNLGDSYAAQPQGNGRGPAESSRLTNPARQGALGAAAAARRPNRRPRWDDVKPKDLIGVPWMVAFALRADGWYLRSEVIWAKPNPMPESVTDRPTRSHEQLFLLSKQPRYFYDVDSIREGYAPGSVERIEAGFKDRYQDAASGGYRGAYGGPGGEQVNPAGRNKRSVWTVATQPFSSERLGLGGTEHFAVFPPKLIEPCVLAGSSPRACGECGAPWRRVVENHGPDKVNAHNRHVPGGQRRQQGLSGVQMGARWDRETVGWEPSCEHDDDSGRSVVLDPFNGAGTVGVVCGWHGRDYIGIELNAAYAAMSRERIALEGRPGGRPVGHEPSRADGHPTLFDGVG